MSTETKQRANIFAVLKNMFSSEPDIDDCEDIELPSELKDALKELESREKIAEQAINMESSSSKKGGFSKKINPNTEKAMRAMHNQIKQNTMDDRERE